MKKILMLMLIVSTFCFALPSRSEADDPYNLITVTYNSPSLTARCPLTVGTEDWIAYTSDEDSCEGGLLIVSCVEMVDPYVEVTFNWVSDDESFVEEADEWQNTQISYDCVESLRGEFTPSLNGFYTGIKWWENGELVNETFAYVKFWHEE